MPITRMTLTFSSTPPRKKPKLGDRRTIRGIEHIRVHEKVRGMYVVSGSRYVWKWVPLEQAKENGAWHCLTREEMQRFAPTGEKTA